MISYNSNEKKLIVRAIILFQLIILLFISILYVSSTITNDCNFKQSDNLKDDIFRQENPKISNPGPILSYYGIQINDDDEGNSEGDNDGRIDAGETIELRITLQNTGDENTFNVNATISSTNNYLTIINNYQDFTTIFQGNLGNSASFYVIKVNSSCPADYYITINIEIKSSNGGPWYDSFQIHVIGRGNPIYHTFLVYSESSGDLPADNDDIIDPGEIIHFDIKVKNNGDANIYGLTGLIEGNDIYTVIHGSSDNFGDIDGNGDISSGRFGITISGSCPERHQIDFNLTLTDNDETIWKLAFYIIVSGISEYTIIDYDVIETDDSYGDEDDDIDAGEEWYLKITIKNIGSAMAKNVKVLLDSDDDYITFNDDDDDYRWITCTEININEIYIFGSSSNWGFKIDGTNTPKNHKIKFDIIIKDYTGREIELEITIKVIEGGTLSAEIDWATVGIVFLIILGILGGIIFLIANSWYNWDVGHKIKDKFSNISAFRYNKKQKKLREKELAAKTFENLMQRSKELNDLGKDAYSKQSFEQAINHWKEAINNYELALEKSPSSEQKKNIRNYQHILFGNICYAYIENGKEHDKAAKEAHKDKNLHKAEMEWNEAKSDFQTAINNIKSKDVEIPYEQIEIKLTSIDLNLKQLEIEKSCLDADELLEKGQSLQTNNLEEAIKCVQNAISKYFKAKNEAANRAEFQDLVYHIQGKLESARSVQTELHDKMDELLGITPVTTKVITDDQFESERVETIIKAGKREKALSIIREYEFMGGQIRFKVALINNTRHPLTNFRVAFDIPDAVKWINHEPKKYERKGDSILINKLGVNEKKTISLYLEPINCMQSPINATVSFFDANDRPQAVPMKPKMISITCPIFFTEKEANLARVKKLHKELNHRDKKVFPINQIEKTSLIFSSVLSALNKHHIKLIFKDYSEKDKLGKAWYYGITKVKKERIVIYVLIDGNKRILEIEVSGNIQDQITAFLAEIGNDIRKDLLEHNVINSEDEFYDMDASIQLYQCPYCCEKISTEVVEKYLEGMKIKCKYCSETLTLKE